LVLQTGKDKLTSILENFVRLETATNTWLRYTSREVAVTLLEAAAEDGAVYASIEKEIKALVDNFLMDHGRDILWEYMAQREVTAGDGGKVNRLQMLMRPLI
jgi:hypothetical protein